MLEALGAEQRLILDALRRTMPALYPEISGDLRLRRFALRVANF